MMATKDPTVMNGMNSMNGMKNNNQLQKVK
jgi:hypothetical protein